MITKIDTSPRLDSDYTSLSLEFRAHLKYFGWSQDELARRIGVTRETVSRWNWEPPTVVMLYLREKRKLDDYKDSLRAWIEES